MPDDLDIVVPPGLGDFSWVYSKLCRLSGKLNVRVATPDSKRPIPKDGPPVSANQRLQPMLELLPKVRSVAVDRMTFNSLRRRAVPSNATLEQLDQRRLAGALCVEANTHLEHGHRIEKWLPDIPVNHHYPINISRQYSRTAEEKVPDGFEGFIAIFAASEGTARAWNAWFPQQWITFMVRLRKEVGDVPFVMLGAPWDVGMAEGIERLAKQNHVKLLNLVAKTHIAEALHLIQKSRYFVSFPSGLGILSDVMKAPATMFYPTALTSMIRSYADPESTETSRFFESLFMPPEEYVRWLVDVYKLKDQLC